MKIAQVAPLDYLIPPRQYGGVERVVDLVCSALVDLGHDVTLFALKDSESRARLAPVDLLPIDVRDEGTTRQEAYYHNDLLASVYRARESFDVIHSHLEYLTFPFARATAYPTVVTQHGRLDTPDLRQIYSRGVPPSVSLSCVSAAQWEPMSTTVETTPRLIPNPVPLDSYTPVDAKSDYMAFLGRISPEKAPHVAARLSQESGVALVAAGVVHPGDELYWEEVVEPAFRKADVEWIGAVDDVQKQELLGNARLTLFPSDWPEAFGLVQLESMACGTPVVSLDRGAAREIVDHGLSGFVCHDYDEMLSAIDNIDQLDAHDCRTTAERYSPETIAMMYLDLFSEAVLSAY